MSERRKVRSALTDAELQIDHVISALNEAERSNFNFSIRT
jgi:hypothetical protein